MSEVKIKIEKIAYHRNGISGNGFHVMLFQSKEDNKTTNMMGVVFEEPGSVAVFDRDLLASGVIEFAVNSWRGDWFERQLRDAIKIWNEKAWNDLFK